MNIKSLGKGIKVYEFTCYHCKSVIEYTKSDIQKTGYWNRINMEESEYIGYEYVRCPVCQNTHKIADINKYY